MALLTFGSTPTKGETTTVTLDKTELLALPEVSGDTFWSDPTNIKAVSINFKSTQGGQRRRLSFDFTQTTPTSGLALSARARNNFQIETIVLQDFDAGSFVITRSTFVASTPTLASLDFAVAPAGGGGGGGDTTPPALSSSSLSIGTVTDTSIAITWVDATDDVTSQSQLEYKVVYSTISSHLDNIVSAESLGTVAYDWTPASSNSGSATISGLSASTQYYFTVLVRDAAGNKAKYATDFTTTAAASVFPNDLGVSISAVYNLGNPIALSVGSPGSDASNYIIDIYKSTSPFVDSAGITAGGTLVHNTSGPSTGVLTEDLGFFNNSYPDLGTYYYAAVVTELGGSNNGRVSYSVADPLVIEDTNTPYATTLTAMEAPGQGISLEFAYGTSDGWDQQLGGVTLSFYGGFTSTPTTLAQVELGTLLASIPSVTGASTGVEYHIDSSVLVGGEVPAGQVFYYAAVVEDQSGNKSFITTSYVEAITGTFRSLGVTGSSLNPVLGGTFPNQVNTDTYSYYFIEGGTKIRLTAQLLTGLIPLQNINTEGAGVYEIALPAGLDFAPAVVRTSGLTPTGAAVLGANISRSFFDPLYPSSLYIYQYSGPNHPADSFDASVTAHAGPTGILLRLTANSSQTHPAGGNVGWWGDLWGKVVPSEPTAYGFSLFLQLEIPVQSV